MLGLTRNWPRVNPRSTSRRPPPVSPAVSPRPPSGSFRRSFRIGLTRGCYPLTVNLRPHPVMTTFWYRGPQCLLTLACSLSPPLGSVPCVCVCAHVLVMCKPSIGVFRCVCGFYCSPSGYVPWWCRRGGFNSIHIYIYIYIYT